MMVRPNYTFFKAVILGAMLLLNSCDNCKNLHKPSQEKQTLKDQSTPPNSERKPERESEPESEPGPKPELTPDTETPVKNKGISNIGNSCYMNSVIQILASFYGKAFEKKYEELKEDALAKAGNEIIRAITGQEEVSQNEIMERARNFFNALKSTHTTGGVLWKPACGSQEDAAELFAKIFEWLEMPNAQTSYKLVNPETNAERTAGLDPWSVWNIPIPETQHHLKTMQDFFDNSLAPEHNVEVQWQDADLKNTDADKIPSLQELDKLHGKMLIVNLKRFQYEKDAAKLYTNVEKPFELTIKHQYTVDSNQDLHYQLAGFIEHSGDTGGGHYVAYTKVGSKWIYYSDSTVNEVSTNTAEAAAKRAYLFFYKQLDF